MDTGASGGVCEKWKAELSGFVDGLDVGYERQTRIRDNARFLCVCVAALGLCYCARAFSSCGEQGLLFFAVHRLLIFVASLVAEHGL